MFVVDRLVKEKRNGTAFVQYQLCLLYSLDACFYHITCLWLNS